MVVPQTIFDRLIARSQPLYARLVVVVIYLAALVVAAALDGVLGELRDLFTLRVLLLAPTVSIYIWLVSPVMARFGQQVELSLRPLIDCDDEAFEQLQASAGFIKPSYELLVLTGGLVIGVVTTLASGFEQLTPWLGVYWLLTAALMYGLLMWVILISVLSTRLIARFHQAIGAFDILDPRPFEPVGKQSLLLALVFIGGISISFLFSFQPTNLASAYFWFEYGIMVLLVLLIFFLNMRPTHRLMAAQKNKALGQLQGQIHFHSRELLRRLQHGQPVGELPGVIQSLAVFEAHLLNAPTWPYNTAMLRALVFSVLIPMVSVLARVLVELIK